MVDNVYISFCQQCLYESIFSGLIIFRAFGNKSFLLHFKPTDTFKCDKYKTDLCAEPATSHKQ